MLAAAKLIEDTHAGHTAAQVRLYSDEGRRPYIPAGVWLLDTFCTFNVSAAAAGESGHSQEKEGVVSGEVSVQLRCVCSLFTPDG